MGLAGSFRVQGLVKEVGGEKFGKQCNASRYDRGNKIAMIALFIIASFLVYCVWYV